MSPASVSITFDNLGEAAELERGASPDDVQAGEHFSVVEVLPRLVELLDRHGVDATFFVEGLNAELYPSALRDLDARGHEVALHGWRHEEWAELPGERERELLERGTGALRSLGIEPAGFRPPGGRLTDATPGLLRELGYRYHSPEGERASMDGGLAVLPFRWELIDAYFYVPGFADRREAGGDPSDPMEPAELRDRVLGALDGLDDGHLALIFHPFLFTVDPEKTYAVLDDVIDRASDRCVRMDEAARRLLDG